MDVVSQEFLPHDTTSEMLQHTDGCMTIVSRCHK